MTSTQSQVSVIIPCFRQAHYLEECLTSGQHADTVATDMEEGAAAGMTGTPGFYVNGRFISGAQPLEVFTGDRLALRGEI